MSKPIEEYTVAEIIQMAKDNGTGASKIVFKDGDDELAGVFVTYGQRDTHTASVLFDVVNTMVEYPQRGLTDQPRIWTADNGN